MSPKTVTTMCKSGWLPGGLAALLALLLVAMPAQAQQVDLRQALGAEAYQSALANVTPVLDHDCAGGEQYDDGTFENGYSGNPGVIDDFDVNMLFTPAAYPFVYTEVCIVFTQNGGSTLDFDVVIFDDDGPGGEPGTLLYSESFSISGIPGFPASQLYSFELAAPPTITDGSVFIGASWNPMAFPGRFASADESISTPLRTGFVRFLPANSDWLPTQTIFTFPPPGYRAQGIRASGGIAITPVDIAVEKTIEFDGDGEATFFIKVTNDGPEDATGVVVQDILEDVTLNDVDASQGSYDAIFGLWQVGDLAADEMATLELEVTLDREGEFVNCAALVAVNEDDTNSDNDEDCAAILFNRDREDPEFERGLGPGRLVERGGRRFVSDLELDKEVDVSSAAADDEVVYTLTVTNDGPQNNAGIVVTDRLPACLVFDSASTEDGDIAFDAATNTVTWDVGELRDDEDATLLITATVTDACTDEVTNTAAITEANLPDPDRNLIDPFGDTPEPDEEASATFSVSAASARTAVLLDAYPNPFNPATVVPFQLDEAAHVTVAVYDLLGRQVQLLADGRYGAGRHEVTFRGHTLPTGMYLVRMEAAGVVSTQRITLLK